MDSQKSNEQTCFLVTFRDPESEKPQNTVLRVKNISDSNLGLTFVAISGFIFEDQGVVIDPNQERLKKRYENTETLHLNIHSIISIEEVGRENKGLHFKNRKDNVFVLPKGPENKALGR